MKDSTERQTMDAALSAAKKAEAKTRGLLLKADRGNIVEALNLIQDVLLLLRLSGLNESEASSNGSRHKLT